MGKEIEELLGQFSLPNLDEDVLKFSESVVYALLQRGPKAVSDILEKDYKPSMLQKLSVARLTLDEARSEVDLILSNMIIEENGRPPIVKQIIPAKYKDYSYALMWSVHLLITEFIVEPSSIKKSELYQLIRDRLENEKDISHYVIGNLPMNYKGRFEDYIEYIKRKS